MRMAQNSSLTGDFGAEKMITFYWKLISNFNM
jgi:hypothetical protein